MWNKISALILFANKSDDKDKGTNLGLWEKI